VTCKPTWLAPSPRSLRLKTSPGRRRAMSILGIGDRTTNDLDYFATAARAVDEVRPAIERGLRHAGLTVTLERLEPGFARM